MGIPMSEIARMVVTGELRAQVLGSSRATLESVVVLDRDVSEWITKRDQLVRSLGDQMEAARVLGRRYSARNWPPGIVKVERSHADQVLIVLVAHGVKGCSRAELARRLRRSWVNAATVSIAVESLASAGLVTVEHRAYGPGRPSVMLTATEDGVRRAAKLNAKL